MDQMQSSCLNLMQMVTAQTAKTEPSKGESSGGDKFRKLLEKCGSQNAEAEPVHKTEQTVEAEQKPGTEQADIPETMQVPVLSEFPVEQVFLPGENDEEILRMQELAAMEMLCAEQRIVVEAVPVAETQAANAVAETVVENTPVPADGQMPTERPAGQEVQTASVKPVETAENSADLQQGSQPDLSEQSHMTEVRGQTEQERPETRTEMPEDVEMPVFQSVETTPIKVGETAAPTETVQAESVEEQIADKLTETLSSGETRVEIRLTPENLGKVTIEVTQKEDGSLHIALQAESSQTRTLLERDVSGLQSLLSRTTQQEVQVNVSQPQEQQQQQNYDGHQQQQQQQQEQREHRQSSEDFLNQLRLGLLIPEAEAS